jgi:hypothetical protein
MRVKTVIDSNGRTWQVRRSIEWSRPATGDDFEHDIDAGQGAAVLILSSLAVFWIILFVWSPPYLHVPALLVWAGVALLAVLFPARWWTRRQWTLVAETPGDYDSPAEKWTGLIRGSTKAREEQRVVVRMLETQGTPAHADSPLQPVN